jgi:hypothetical protein
VGCGSLTVTIRRQGDVVEWNDIRDGDQTVAIGPFRFDAVQYEQEVRRAHAHRAWESRTERVARLVGESLRPAGGQGRPSFDWASGSWGDDFVVVSLTERRPNSHAGTPAGPRRHAPGGGYWQSIEPPETVQHYVGKFPISSDANDVAAAEEILERIRGTDPASWSPP